MLDDFIESQPQAYHFFQSAIKKNRCNHAYLIETNGYAKGEQLALAFAKYLFCPHHYTNATSCANCKQCQTIDDNNFLELEIIAPDGLWIKKGQLESLQQDFSKKSLVGNKKIYILMQADKLNSSAANSILKFLEEPEEGIIAILLVDNIYQVLPTIRSRCQIIRLIPTPEIIKDEEAISNVFSFMQYYEQHGLSTILKDSLWLSFFKEKASMRDALEILLFLYKDLLNIKLHLPCEYYLEYEEKLKLLQEKNTISMLCNKINSIAQAKEKLKVNANTNLLLDKLLITLERSREV